MTESDEHFHIGDIVKLKSGGDAMTVVMILVYGAERSGDPDGISCAWHSGDGYPQRTVYPADAIFKVIT